MAEAGRTIRLRTLGSLQLHDAAGEDARSVLAQTRRVALLVYLAVAAPRGFHRRDRLLALFWPDHDELRARNALSQALHFLRRALGAEIIFSHADDEIGVNRDLLWCDAIEIESALASGRLEDALDLYRGPFLDGVHISSAAPDLQEWIEAERTRLGECYAKVLKRMADDREAAGDYAGAAVWLRKLVSHDPLDWHATLLLMRALAAGGDNASALKYARVHETLIREQLGSPVHPEIAAFGRTLQASPQTVSARPAPIPPPAPTPDTPAAPPSGESTGSPASTEMTPRQPMPPRGRSTAVMRAAYAIAAIGIISVAGFMLPRMRRSATGAGPPIRCLAVLPLENLSRDSSQEYFADGVTDALITELARHEHLTVISRTSVTRYKRSTKPLPAIARDLGCDGIIEGTVSTDGNRVHVNAQLLYAPGDRHLWAAGYDGELKNVLALEREIADSIANQVHGVTTPSPRAVASVVDPIAYGQYLRGRELFRSRNPASLRQAIALFEQAISRDSGFALAYAGLADAYRFLGGLGYAPRPLQSDSARMMAARALELDSTLSEAHTSLAALLTDDADWSRAESEFRRAIALQPGNSLAHQWYAIMLATIERKAEALAEIRRAEVLDPLSQPLRSARVDIERLAGVRDTARVLTDRSTMLDPNDPGTVAFLSINLARQGKCADAYRENGRAQQLAPDNTAILVSLVGVHKLCNRRKEARALLDTIEHRPDAARNALWIAQTFAASNPDSAFAWLERCEWGMASRFQLRVSLWLAPVRSDSRYASLLSRAGMR
jgi:TolB-like protein/DNA-binding SARP family transcriptional activator/Tfp pilus assembly protein PilF